MSFNELFQNGVKSFKSQEFDKASVFFNQALDLQPENTTVLVNLAATQYQLGLKTAAFAYYKKALYLDPSLSTAQQGLDFVKSQVQIREIPHRIETYQKTREYLIEPFSVFVPLILTTLLFAMWGARTLKYFGQKKRAYLAGENLPAYGFLNFILSILLIISFSWVGFFKFDSSLKRGLVKLENVSVKSSPLLTAPEILQIYGGLEVQILRHQDGWLQIEYPGSIAGWVEPGSILEL